MIEIFWAAMTICILSKPQKKQLRKEEAEYFLRFLEREFPNVPVERYMIIKRIRRQGSAGAL